MNPIIDKSILVEAPASIANMGPGYDIVAIAVRELRDRVKISVKKGYGKIRVQSLSKEVPSGRGNIAYVVAEKILEEYGIDNVDVEIIVDKGIPVSAGLGGSGATAVATAYGLSVLLNLNMSRRELLKIAGLGEGYIAGTPHYDNVAASLYGGAVLVDPVELKVYSIKPSYNLWIGVIVPVNRDKEYKTRKARSVIPRKLDLEIHVKQSASIAKLIHSLHTGDIEVLGKAISSDYIIEPHRANLIRKYWEIKKLALKLGARGFNIAGAGPSVFFIHDSYQTALRILKNLSFFLESHGERILSFLLNIDNQGVRVLDNRVNLREN